MRKFLPFLICLALIACKQKETPETEVPETKIETPSQLERQLNWVCEQSNDYSGVLNKRQTWELSYKEGVITEKYYFDQKLQELTTIPIKEIDRVSVEERFTNSVAIYPKNNDYYVFKTLRYEDGEEKLIEAKYHNIKVEPANRRNVQRKLEYALEAR